MREQSVVLEHHGGPPLYRRKIRDVLVADQDVPFTDRLMSGDHPQDAGLAAAARPEQAAVAGSRDTQRDLVNRQSRAIALCDSDKFYVVADNHITSCAANFMM